MCIPTVPIPTHGVLAMWGAIGGLCTVSSMVSISAMMTQPKSSGPYVTMIRVLAGIPFAPTCLISGSRLAGRFADTSQHHHKEVV